MNDALHERKNYSPRSRLKKAVVGGGKERPLTGAAPDANAAMRVNAGRFCNRDPAPLMQWVGNVQGAITGKDVLLHSFTILKLWGPGVYVRCLRAMVSRRPCTFLGVLADQR
jgi:hypothetical protein